MEQVLTKSLGVTIDDKLCWNCHIEKLTKKIACGIGDMKRVSNVLGEPVEKLQNRAARILTFSNYDAELFNFGLSNSIDLVQCLKYGKVPK